MKLCEWANIIFVKEVPMVTRLELWFFMFSNNSLALFMKPLRHRVERAILKIAPLIAEWNVYWRILLFFYIDILTNEKGNESLLSTDLYIKVPSLMVISKFKTYHDHPDVTPQVQTPLDIFHKKTYQSLHDHLQRRDHQWSALLSGNFVPWFYQRN